MGIEAVSDKQIASVIQRYRDRGETHGGPYSLAELLLEQKRRSPSALPVVALAKAIIDLSRTSPDGLIAYHDLWVHFRPNEPWKGHGSLTIMASALARVIGYCVQHGLPILTVLVVPKQSRKLTEQAVGNIYSECRELGIDVGSDPAAFVAREVIRARQLSTNLLPEEPE